MERQIGYGINAESFKISKVRLFGKTILLLPKVCHSGVAWDEVQARCNSSKERSSNGSADGGQEGDSQQSTPLSQKDSTNSFLQEDIISYSGSNDDCEEVNKLAKMFRVANGSAVPPETSETIISEEVIGELQTKRKHRKKPQRSALQEHIYYQCEKSVPCPRCGSLRTKFCYYNNYNLNQPRHFCKNCQRYWTAGGILRHVPMGAGRRRNKQGSPQHGNAFSDNINTRAEGVLTAHDILPCVLTHSPTSPAATSSIINLNELYVRVVPKLNLNMEHQESFGWKSPAIR